MTDNVVDFRGVTKLDIDPDRVTSKCIGELNQVVVIGYDKNDDFYFASSIADGGDILWLIELAKKKLMDICDD